jgi:murein DD-endopeptidase MepM/ murein hydrolase activator NlpD
MAKVKYRYNPDTLSYDRIKTGFKYYLSRSLYIGSTSIVLSIVLFFSYHEFFNSPKEKRLIRENEQQLAQIDNMQKDLEQLQLVLSDLEQRDENIYRVIFQADSIPKSIRMAGFGGVNRYSQLDNLSNGQLVKRTARLLDVVMRQAYIQSKSYDEIENLARDQDKLLRCTPSIMPIKNKDLTRTASGWGYRSDPIYKVKKFHEGMDFTSPVGTKVYATGNGVIELVTEDFSGYGRHIVINHGFGYKTLYGHLSGFNVREGEAIKRGDVIGYVGNTGKSTGPHLHYEVWLKGIKQNPQYYYFQEDLTAAEYDKMIQISTNSNQTFD